MIRTTNYTKMKGSEIMYISRSNRQICLCAHCAFTQKKCEWRFFFHSLYHRIATSLSHGIIDERKKQLSQTIASDINVSFFCIILFNFGSFFLSIGSIKKWKCICFYLSFLLIRHDNKKIKKKSGNIFFWNYINKTSILKKCGDFSSLFATFQNEINLSFNWQNHLSKQTRMARCHIKKIMTRIFFRKQRWTRVRNWQLLACKCFRRSIWTHIFPSTNPTTTWLAKRPTEIHIKRYWNAV